MLQATVLNGVAFDPFSFHQDDRALRRPLLRLDQQSIFEHACRQPFGDQPDHSPVANPMLDEADQPILVNLVERLLDRLPTTALIISTTIPIR
jgi:hypothetical protein